MPGGVCWKPGSALRVMRPTRRAAGSADLQNARSECFLPARERQAPSTHLHHHPHVEAPHGGSRWHLASPGGLRVLLAKRTLCQRDHPGAFTPGDCQRVQVAPDAVVTSPLVVKASRWHVESNFSRTVPLRVRGWPLPAWGGWGEPWPGCGLHGDTQTFIPRSGASGMKPWAPEAEGVCSLSHQTTAHCSPAGPGGGQTPATAGGSQLTQV